MLPLAILDPDHLLDQADALIRGAGDSLRAQIDFRRAISAAYYSVFHTITGAAADRIVGADLRATPLYALVYRDVDHRTLSNLCGLASRSQLPPKYRLCCPAGHFGDDMRRFCEFALDLQQRRNAADYDPGYATDLAVAALWIDNARAAIRHWHAAPASERDAFLLLLLFPPR